MVDTTDDSLRLRLKARARLRGSSWPPSIIVLFCYSQFDEKGNVIEPGDCDSHRASIGDFELTREPGESYEAFEGRVRDMLPVRIPAFAVMWPDGLPEVV